MTRSRDWFLIYRQNFSSVVVHPIVRSKKYKNIWLLQIEKINAFKFLEILILKQVMIIERKFYFMTKPQQLISTKCFNWMRSQNPAKNSHHHVFSIVHEISESTVSDQVALWFFPKFNSEVLNYFNFGVAKRLNHLSESR